MPISGLTAVLVCLFTPPDDRDVLESFYRDVRPWGFWRPIRESLTQKFPHLEKNRNFWMDAFNVANGIVWQLTLMIVPICLVIRKYDTMVWALVVLVITSITMKFTWYDRLGPGEMYLDDDTEVAVEPGGPNEQHRVTP